MNRETEYTDHAKIRMQQRAVPPLVVSLLLDYGERAPARRRAEIFLFWSARS